MKLSILPFLVVLSISRGAFGQTSCTDTPDCVETEFCAPGAAAGTLVCTAYGCDEFYEIVKPRYEGMADLMCADYEGDEIGQVYACKVGQSFISGVGASLSITPDDGSATTQKFQRMCTADIPASADDTEGHFYCLDNQGASYSDYLGAVDSSALDCGEDAPIHASRRWNFLGGISTSAVKDETFSEDVANSGFIVSIREGTAGSGGGGGDGDGGDSGGDETASAAASWANIVPVISLIIAGATAMM